MNKINMDSQQTDEKCSIQKNATSTTISHISFTSTNKRSVGKNGGK